MTLKMLTHGDKVNGCINGDDYNQDKVKTGRRNLFLACAFNDSLLQSGFTETSSLSFLLYISVPTSPADPV